ncbi:restriction endonuclease [Methylobacterium sp. 4-46]|uniref:restriction endonuclease n=1 Tax=unclassified Methylobacterium TaxID=2615210 RepID=UPI000152CF8B|nr:MULTISPECIES: restriction endonuclease [Methylobacterium]ACA18762.1 restriction endonuclease [Methylobacterium sp. 4-46]WFT77992.1 restriction endonuclease [Methylobacterium nodulans]
MAAPRSIADLAFWPVVAGTLASLWIGRAALAAGGLALAVILVRRLGRGRRFRRRARALVARHREVLALRRRQESYLDAYDNLILDGWERERAYYIARTLVPRLEAEGYADLIPERRADLVAIVEAASLAPAGPEEELPDDGIAYERYCAALLERAGWAARATRASGDQGADVIAEQRGVRLVLQCKRYTKPVGNAAVQEVVAARSYWSADWAAVVSNAGFTPAARKLAAATDVLLLHHDDLAVLELDEG